MASTSSHLQQWKHNRDFLPHIPSSYTDWIVTVVFYTALHAVDALLAADKVPRIIDHHARNAVLMNTNKYLRIWKCYSPLYSLSRTVRYLADPISWVSFSQVQEQVFARYLYPIEKSVKGLLMDRNAIRDSDWITKPISFLANTPS